MGASSMAAALAARDAGIESSALHAEDVMPGWGELAFSAVMASVYLFDQEWTMDFARQWLYACDLPRPVEERAWGAVTQRLLREGIIEKTGGFAPAASSHGSPKPLYRKRENGDA